MKNTLPIDYFYNNFDVFAAKNFGVLDDIDGYAANIRRAIEDIQNSHVALGYALIAYAESHTFGIRSSNNFCDCRSEVFFARCFQQFELDKSSVSRHVNVVYRFGDGKGGLRSVYRDKSFSFLAELLPLDEIQIDHCLRSYNTVADVRKYKAELAAGLKEPKPVATSQQPEASPEEQPVATSQQQSEPCNFFHKIIIPPSDLYSYFAKYDRFRGKFVQYLCDKVIELEKLNNELIAQLDKLDKEDDLLMASGLAVPLPYKGSQTAIHVPNVPAI